MPDAHEVASLVAAAHRDHWAAVLATTACLTRDLDGAEDAAQEAYVRALREWPGTMPDNPVGWLVTVARRLALELLALILFAESRGASRVDPSGDLVLLADQDRSRWDSTLVEEGLTMATKALGESDGRFALQAGIAGLHMSAPSWDRNRLGTGRAALRRLGVAKAEPIVDLNRGAALL